MHYLIDYTLATPQYEVAFIAILHSRYIPGPTNATRKEESICTCSVTTACDLSAIASLEGFTLLNDSLAISLELVAKEQRDRGVLTSSIRYYPKALKGLRTALERNSTKETLYGCLCCMSCRVPCMCNARGTLVASDP